MQDHRISFELFKVLKILKKKVLHKNSLTVLIAAFIGEGAGKTLDNLKKGKLFLLLLKD